MNEELFKVAFIVIFYAISTIINMVVQHDKLNSCRAPLGLWAIVEAGIILFAFVSVPTLIFGLTLLGIKLLLRLLRPVAMSMGDVHHFHHLEFYRLHNVLLLAHVFP